METRKNSIAGRMTAVGVLTDYWCRNGAVSALLIVLCATGYVGSLRCSVALEQFQPLMLWVGGIFVHGFTSLPLTLSLTLTQGLGASSCGCLAELECGALAFLAPYILFAFSSR